MHASSLARVRALARVQAADACLVHGALRRGHRADGSARVDVPVHLRTRQRRPVPRRGCEETGTNWQNLGRIMILVIITIMIIIRLIIIIIMKRLFSRL